MAAQSGDYCSLGRKPVPAHFITHYQCDDYPDGTVTDALTGKIVKHAAPGALRGFKREGK